MGKTIASLAVGILALSGCGWFGSNNSSTSSSSSISSNSPYYHQIYLATSNDGFNWTVSSNVVFDHASVPGAVRWNGLVYLYFVDAEDPANEKISVAVSTDNGRTFGAKQTCSISGSSSSHPVDPNPIVDESGIRLTYMGNLGASLSDLKIVTALSSDGTTFTEEAVLVTGTGYVDPDLFYYGGQWNLFVHDDPNDQSLFFTSSSPTGTFTQVNTANFHGTITSTVTFNNTAYTYYHHRNINVGEFSSGAVTTINANIIDSSSITTAASVVADPTVVVNSASDFILYFKFQEVQ